MRVRDAGIPAECDHQGRSLKSQFKQADRSDARHVVILGPDEAAVGEVTVRDMDTRAEHRVAIESLVDHLVTVT
jgi:histidyl-tRNA synthetase